MSDNEALDSVERIAIVGMSGRFPGARNVLEFWRNLRAGVESIATFTEEELLAYGVDPELLKSANYVRARGVLDEIELFDAAFFGVSPREAELMDPQIRFFLENSWEAMENAGYDPQTYQGVIGIFGGMSLGQYWLRHLLPNHEVVASAGGLQLRILNDKDFLTTQVAYKLNLKGPTVNVQTACSTSLVAVHLACQSLLSYQCDMALAGGVSILVPQKSGYLPQEGVFSPDGHCRAFDADAKGTVSGNGVGVVVFKRMSDALADGDHIRAIVRGSAINNDGSLKVSYTAPSVDGQAEVIAMAQAVAGVKPETITYIETHGTGTPLGDPIEVAALTQVFRASTGKKEFCAIGSVKTNVGHSDAAAGITSLIKTVLALEHKALPPSLNFKRSNPQIDFANSPFYVNASLKEWRANEFPRRAGISAFAVGGTNAHVIVEEAPELEPSGPSRSWQLIPLSAKTESAIEAATEHLADFLTQPPNHKLADVAYSLQVGRRAFEQRRIVVCRETAELVDALKTRNPKRVLTSMRVPAERPVAFMFPGLGNHYVNMGWELYQSEPVFRRSVDLSCELLKPHLESDLRDIIYPDWRQDLPVTPEVPERANSNLDLRQMLRGENQENESARRLNQTLYSQPALFVIEYALACLWMSWGIKPQALVGYSIGEYVAACLAGVYSLQDALMLVARRAQLIQQLPGGSMLAVSLPAHEVQPLLKGNLSLAAVNGPSVCVVSGAAPEVSALEAHLTGRGVVARRLQTTHAFHSSMMEPVVESFTQLFRKVRLYPPKIALLSDVTGGWLSAAQATSPQYWGTHLCRPVLFGDALQELWKELDPVLLEVGPGQALGAWAMQHPESRKSESRSILASLRHSYDRQSDQAFLLTTLGRLWLAGCNVDWPQFHAAERRVRVPLPGYPFERTRHWIEPPKRSLHEQVSAPPPNSGKRKQDITDWFYFPGWKLSPPLPVFDSAKIADQKRNYLLFNDPCGVGLSLAMRLRQMGQTAVIVNRGDRFVKVDAETFLIDPKKEQDYDSLLSELHSLGKLPQVVYHLWSVTPLDNSEKDLESYDKYLEAGFYSLLFLARSLGNRNFAEPLRLLVVSNGLCAVNGEEPLAPAKATVLGPCKVIPQEYPQVSCQSIDIVIPLPDRQQAKMLTEQLLGELAANAPDPVVAYRANHRWLQTFDPLRLAEGGEHELLLRDRGIYLITGGLGGIGLTLAEYIARQVRGRLVLTGRSAFPEKEEWEGWLAKHDERDEVSRKIKKVQMLESMGAEVLVVRADVTSRHEMRRALAQAREVFGEINGVIHAAGVPPGGMMQVKAPESAARVLAPKVAGTLLLEDLLKEDQLDFFILCSSLSAITGAFGLVDHCGANAFLDAFAEDRSARGQHQMLSFAWDAWLKVGQAANATVSTGLQELLHVARGKEGTHPLLSQLLVDEPAREIYSTELSTARQWVVNEHRLMGHGVVPGTAYLEMVRAAFAGRAGDRPIVMQKVSFLSPLIVNDGEVKETRLVLTKPQTEDGPWQFSIVSDASTDEDAEPQWQEHVRGKITRGQSESPKRHPLAEILERLQPQAVDIVIEKTRAAEGPKKAAGISEGEFKKFGPRWRNLVRSVGLKGDEGIACLELPEEFADDLLTFKMHPALMDAATGFVQLAGDGPYLPLAYEVIKVQGVLTRKLYSYVKYKENNSAKQDILVCDLIIMDEDGREVIEIQEYILRKLADLEAFGSAARADLLAGDSASRLNRATRLTSDTPPTATSGSITNEGILPAEGAEAFDRILRSGLRVSRIAVSTRELRTLIEQSRALTNSRILDEVTKLQSQRQKHSRPNLQVPFVAARVDMERRMAAIWQEALSIEEVGIHDNFFDMGGDSLIATLLIGRLSEDFHVDLSLRTLFDAPTIAELAVAIVRQQAQQVNADALSELLTEIKHLSKDEVRAMLRDEKQADQ
jgi:acyl transferase domain-containing protein